MLTTLHWEGKPSNLTYHNNRSLFFIILLLRKGGRGGVEKVRSWWHERMRKIILLGGGNGKRRETISVVAHQTHTYFKLWQRVNTWNIGFETLYSGQTMLSTWLVTLNYNVILSHPHSSTVSLETYPLYLLQTVLHMCSTLEKVRIYFNHKPKKHFILMM